MIFNTLTSMYLFFIILSVFITVFFYFIEKFKIFIIKRNCINYFMIFSMLSAFFITIYTYLDQSRCFERDIFDGHARCYDIHYLTHISFNTVPENIKFLIFSFKILSILFISIAIFNIFRLILSTKTFYSDLTSNFISQSFRFKKIAGDINKNLNTHINFQKVNIPVNFTGVTGFFKPLVIIPEKLEKILTDEELEALMYHEACHIINKDNIKRFFILISNSILFFLPFKDIFYKKWDIEREVICDEFSVSYTGSPLHLASALIKTFKMSDKKFTYNVFSGFNKENLIYYRLERLMSYSRKIKSLNMFNKTGYIFYILVLYFILSTLNIFDFLHCSMEFLINISI